MGKINVLDFHVANLIAAGEVVDRPASVIKELLENSIDAGAKVITVETKRGGISFMRVTDNGCGMAKEDVPVCIKRHATSKLKEASDLNGILTLGFRGEALAAIAAVSKLRIITKPPGAEFGTLLRCECGTVLEVAETGCPDGTTVIVEELFASVPARRKFLKRDMVETMAIVSTVEKIALSRPDISIRLICDGMTKFGSAGDGNLKNTIYAVLGREFAGRLLDVGCTTEGVSISGFIGSPTNVRGNRNFQNFFINGRFVKSKTIQAALEQAFESYIPAEKFPCCVLYLKVHPSFVDVNVHPAKLEVKFSNEQTIFNAVYCGVRNTLTNRYSRPSVRFQGKDGEELPFDEEAAAESDRQTAENKLLHPFVPVDDRSGKAPKPVAPPMLPEESPVMSLPDMPVYENHRVQAERPPEGLQVARDGELPEIPQERQFNQEQHEESDPVNKEVRRPYPPQKASAPAVSDNAVSSDSESIPTEAEPLTHSTVLNSPFHTYNEKKTTSQSAAVPVKVPPYRLVGELFHTYIVVELYDKVLLVDKHAAHERIHFEAMKRTYQNGTCYAQATLVPICVTLNPSEYAAVMEFRRDIAAVGFEFDANEETRTLSIRQYPAEFDVGVVGDMVAAMAGQLAEGQTSAGLTRESRYEKALYQAACKASVKAGELNDPAQLRWICDRLLALPDIQYCPHGRPVAVELTAHDLERQFGRIK